jgi:5-methylcytosine-specific restriction endonuclease McrA
VSGACCLVHISLGQTASLRCLGRCLLALHRSQDYLQFGCSNAIHYATSVLGMRADSARQLRRLAFYPESLPQLTQHAQNGTLSWAKLREVAHVATPNSEAFWIEACQNHSYHSELRIQASADAMALLERAMQSLSQEAGRILAPGESLEYLAAEYLSRRPLDTAALEAARHQAQQDRLAQQRQTEALAELAERSARNIAPWNALRAAQITSHGEVHLVQKDKPHWTNPRARHLTPKQRIHILRRDGYRCQCPGCPNQLYLHVHHLTYYCQNGTTTPDNLITLCASCHRNLHNGHLRIYGSAPDNLTFLDGQGRNLGQQHQLEVAEWLDWFLGWPGSQDDSHRARAQGRPLQLTG